jgi:hypothetical protein
VEGSCEHGNEPSGSIKCWEVREWLLKNGSAPRLSSQVSISHLWASGEGGGGWKYTNSDEKAYSDP